jgi:glucose-6-phosphate isomerase
MDNVDPDEFQGMMDLIDPHRTLFVVISKSGGTAETITQFLVAMEVVKGCAGRAWRKHFVIITEPQRGLLRPVANELKMESFAVDPGLGGRWSVLSPVGLFPAAMVGMVSATAMAGVGRLMALTTGAMSYRRIAWATSTHFLYPPGCRTPRRRPAGA